MTWGNAEDVDFEVVIVGSGFSGLGAAVALTRIGIDDFVILEAAAEAGGTWVQNDYPGLEVDMPFFIYSFPFEPKSDWSRVYPSAYELKEYTRHCARDYDLERRTRCNMRVVGARFDEATHTWRIDIEGAPSLVARYLVNATGLIVTPKMPEIEGIEGFEGHLIHTANWDYDYDIRDKRIAVIGTGATAIQLIPAVIDEVTHLDVYQRTPIWLLPKPNPELSKRVQQLLRSFPFLHTAVRWWTNLVVEISMGMGMVRYTRFPWIFAWIEKKMVEFIEREIDDRELQRKLTPDYSFFCKRPSFSNTFYAALNRSHVDVVTEPIDRVTPKGIVTKDGVVREVDALVCATGYNVFNRECMPSYEIVGRDGIELGEFWEKQRFQAYEGASVVGFPNLFFLMGPYSAAGASYFTMIDTQSKHLTRCIREARRRSATCVEVREDAHRRDFEKVQRRRKSMVLFGGKCGTSNSYYFDARGDAPALRPVTGFEHWWNSRRFPLSDYQFSGPTAVPAASGSE